MESAAGLQSGAGDLALITKFMSALDPQSIVRENEMAMAQNAIPAFDQIKRTIKSLATDEKLLDDQRETILTAARKLVKASRSVANDRMNNYKKLGKNMVYIHMHVEEQLMIKLQFQFKEKLAGHKEE